MTQQGLKVGKLAELAQVNSETLRYYERRGLLAEPPRTPAGYRLYPATAVDRLRFIKGAQSLGFTLEEIRELLELSAHQVPERDLVRHKAEEKVDQIEDKIAALRGMQVALKGLIAECEGSGPASECPILHALPTMWVG